MPDLQSAPLSVVITFNHQAATYLEEEGAHGLATETAKLVKNVLWRQFSCVAELPRAKMLRNSNEDCPSVRVDIEAEGAAPFFEESSESGVPVEDVLLDALNGHVNRNLAFWLDDGCEIVSLTLASDNTPQP